MLNNTKKPKQNKPLYYLVAGLLMGNVENPPLHIFLSKARYEYCYFFAIAYRKFTDWFLKLLQKHTKTLQQKLA
ncbi:hypothetical protein NIES2109_17160 [Nostoc sp. HK-01]|nr:hypothetical protein NIES2109_17160 [Nostoc sp. HK-01]